MYAYADDNAFDVTITYKMVDVGRESKYRWAIQLKAPGGHIFTPKTLGWSHNHACTRLGALVKARRCTYKYKHRQHKERRATDRLNRRTTNVIKTKMR